MTAPTTSKRAVAFLLVGLALAASACGDTADNADSADAETKPTATTAPSVDLTPMLMRAGEEPGFRPEALPGAMPQSRGAHAVARGYAERSSDWLTRWPPAERGRARPAARWANFVRHVTPVSRLAALVALIRRTTPRRAAERRQTHDGEELADPVGGLGGDGGRADAGEVGRRVVDERHGAPQMLADHDSEPDQPLR